MSEEVLKPNPVEATPKVTVLPPAGPDEMIRHVDPRITSEEGLRAIRRALSFDVFSDFTSVGRRTLRHAPETE